MKNRKTFSWLLILTLLMTFVLVACNSDSLESTIEDAASQVEQAAEQVGENAQEIADAAEETAQEVEETIDDAAAAADEAVQEAADTVEEAAGSAEEAADEAMVEVDYDTAIYGMIDDLDLTGTEVLFWHQHTGGREEELAKIVDEFNANNEYGITVVASNEGGYGDIYDKMIAGLTTGEVPELVVAYQNQAAAYQVADGLISLDPYINDPVYGLSEEDRADFFAAFIDSDRLPQFDGASFGFPPNRSLEAMYYNQDWLEELGYDGPPTTPDEFVEMACAAAAQPFSANPEPELNTGFEVRIDASAVAAWAFARGVDVYDYENNQFTYNTPELQEALALLAQAVNDGCMAQVAEQYGDQNDFGAGKTLFYQGSTSGLPFVRSAVDDGATGGFNWSIAPIPYTTAEPVMNIYGASVSVPKTTPEQQLAAWLFLKYYTSSDIQARWAEASNYFPVRASVVEGLSDYIAENPAYEAGFELLKYAKAEPPVAGYDNVRDEASQAMSAIVFEGADIEETLANLDATANQLLADSAP
ncbi:MAG: extracellular solute-binding protein [Anaerolineae bacterium]|nr:extracellular solute-binding protein [Anaerolineae bacterium]